MKWRNTPGPNTHLGDLKPPLGEEREGECSIYNITLTVQVEEVRKQRCDKSPIKKSHKAIQSCSPNHHQYLCCLDKGHRGFGFTLCTNKDKLEHYVKKVKGRAEKAGLWNGAYIIKINGINVEGKRPEDVAHMISTLETINLLVVTEETYHCHKICKIPLSTLHWKGESHLRVGVQELSFILLIGFCVVSNLLLYHFGASIGEGKKINRMKNVFMI
uniref:Na(+)/H(+) exchange regulatory cofactor NHE-RF3-like n=1 Tax=Myxine glutinosa TaxID=7769 RepID=UPI00358FE72D